MTTPCPKDETLSAFFDQALSPLQLDQVREHLAGCLACRHKHAGLHRADAALRELPGLTVSPGFDGAFWAKVAALDESRRAPSWWRRFPVGWRPLLVAGLAAGVVAALFFGRPGAPAPTAEEVYLSENLELFSNYELLRQMDVLEHWDAAQNQQKQG